MLWDAIVALTAVAALLLSLKNFSDARKAPEQMDQRRYREQLRSVLYSCKKECEELCGKIKFGNELPDDLPTAIADSRPKVDELALVLSKPRRYELDLFAAHVRGVEASWGLMDDSRKRIKFDADLREASGNPAAPPRDDHVRKRNAAESQLKDSLTQLIERADDLIGTTISLDRK